MRFSYIPYAFPAVIEPRTFHTDVVVAFRDIRECCAFVAVINDIVAKPETVSDLCQTSVMSLRIYVDSYIQGIKRTNDLFVFNSTMRHTISPRLRTDGRNLTRSTSRCAAWTANSTCSDMTNTRTNGRCKVDSMQMNF